MGITKASKKKVSKKKVVKKSVKKYANRDEARAAAYRGKL